MLNGPMNAFFLLIGLIAGAAAAALVLWPRLVRVRSDLEHERERATERLATLGDAQERLSASFKAMMWPCSTHALALRCREQWASLPCRN